jgi:hypothetical protein
VYAAAEICPSSASTTPARPAAGKTGAWLPRALASPSADPAILAKIRPAGSERASLRAVPELEPPSGEAQS